MHRVGERGSGGVRRRRAENRNKAETMGGGVKMVGCRCCKGRRRRRRRVWDAGGAREQSERREARGETKENRQSGEC